MASVDTWLITNGSSIAGALEAHRDTICSALAARLATTYPMLCYDPKRFDGRSFQQQAFRKSPVRLHNLLQAALRLRNIEMIEREYRWLWTIAARYGIARQHLLAQVHWYFDTARAVIHFDDADRSALEAIESAVIHHVNHATMIDPDVADASRSHFHTNGHKRVSA